MRFLRRNIFVLSLIILGSILRLWRFWEPSFSGDEAYFVLSGVSAARGLVDLVIGGNRSVALKNLFLPILQEAHPPLEILVSIPILFLRPREFFVRLVYIALNIIFLVTSFLLVKKLRNSRVALVYLLLISTSAYAIYWSKIAMYQSLAMMMGLLIVLSIIYYLKVSSNHSILYMLVSFSVSLLVFADFPLAFPAVALAFYSNRKRVSGKYVFWCVLIGFLIAGLFYGPWVFYSLKGGPSAKGFNIYLYSKFKDKIDVMGNIRAYWSNFFSFPGVITVWPFAIVSLFLIKKLRYLKFAFLTVIVYLIVYIFKPGVAYWYYVSIFGIICLLAAEWISIAGKWLPIIMIGILFVNLYSIFPMLLTATRPFVDTTKQPDHIKSIGKVAKRCITEENETYISTADYGRSTYYFGRPSFLYEDGTENRVKRMEWAIKGDERIKLVHFTKYYVQNQLEEQLRQKAVSELNYGKEIVFLFKECKL